VKRRTAATTAAAAAALLALGTARAQVPVGDDEELPPRAQPQPPQQPQYPPPQYPQYPPQYPPQQQPPPGYGGYGYQPPPPQYPPPQQYPGGYAGYPPGYGYPYGAQPQPQPPPPAPPAPVPPPVAAPPPPERPSVVAPISAPRLTLRAKTPEAAQLTWACADAIDSGHLDAARARCAEALAKDEDIALLHVLLAQLHPADVARSELLRADELGRRASPGEKLFVDAKRAQLEGRTGDARPLFDALVSILPGEPRALVARARFLKEALRDGDGAVADLQRAIERDPKYGVAHGMLALAQLDRGQLDPALAAAKKYVDVDKSEPNAQMILARVHLRRGELGDAAAAGRRAVALDDKLPAARLLLGDVLVFHGKGREGRTQYGALLASGDGPTHHEAAMREARSWIFDGKVAEAERALYAEADLAERAKRPGDEAEALVEVARLQLDRSAVAEAGQSLRRAQEVLANPDNGPAISAEARRRLGAEVGQVRAMILAAVGERQLAEVRMGELLAQWKLQGDPQAEQKVAALRGWVAARNHDDKSALAQLGGATRPTLRLALALAAQRGGDGARARTIMEDLSKATENELEVALTRPRALAWLKANRGIAAAPPAATAPAPTPTPSPVATPAPASEERTAAASAADEPKEAKEPKEPKGKGGKKRRATAAPSSGGLPHKKADPYSSSTALPDPL